MDWPELAKAFSEVLGFPIPHGRYGATVVDLGCGTGRDVCVLGQLVGEHGQVHGVDMTDEQLAQARGTASRHADRFRCARANTSMFCRLSSRYRAGAAALGLSAAANQPPVMPESSAVSSSTRSSCATRRTGSLSVWSASCARRRAK